MEEVTGCQTAGRFFNEIARHTTQGCSILEVLEHPGPDNCPAISAEELLAQMGWVERLATALLGDPHAAADVAQDAWLVTQAQPAGRIRPGRLKAWLRSVTYKLVQDTKRSSAGRAARERATSRGEAMPSTLDVVERNSLQQRLSSSVMEMREPYRSTILHRYLDGLSTEEIAERMRVPKATVRKRLSRGLVELRKRLSSEAGGLNAMLLLLRPDSIPASLTPIAMSTPGGWSMITVTKLALGTASVSCVLGATMSLPPQQTEEGTPAPSDARDHRVIVEQDVDKEKADARVLVEGSASEEKRRILLEQVQGKPGEPATAKKMKQTELLDTLHQLPADPREVAHAGGSACVDCHVDPSELDQLVEYDLTIHRDSFLPGAAVSDGPQVLWHENGAKSAEGEIYGGERDGLWSAWYPSGLPAESGAYEAGRKQGTWTTWHPKADTQESTGDYLYGSKEGPWKTFHPNGALAWEGSYRGGRVHGQVRTWHENGAQSAQLDYYFDRMHGESSTWHPNGQLASRGRYSFGRRTGRWEVYLPDGNPAEDSGFYENGLRLGD